MKRLKNLGSREHGFESCHLIVSKWQRQKLSRHWRLNIRWETADIGATPRVKIESIVEIEAFDSHCLHLPANSDPQKRHFDFFASSSSPSLSSPSSSPPLLMFRFWSSLTVRLCCASICYKANFFILSLSPIFLSLSLSLSLEQSKISLMYLCDKSLVIMRLSGSGISLAYIGRPYLNFLHAPKIRIGWTFFDFEIYLKIKLCCNSSFFNFCRLKSVFWRNLGVAYRRGSVRASHKATLGLNLGNWMPEFVTTNF